MDELEEIRDDKELFLYQAQEDLDNFTIPEEISEEIHPELDSDDDSPDIIVISASKDPWTCGICKELFTDPVESACCHDLFCEKCVICLSRCPRCKIPTNWVSNLPVRRIMEEMMVKCRHELCGRSFRKVELVKHEAMCELAMIQCRNSGRCLMVCRKDLERHYREECEYRPVECSSGCGKSLPRCDVEAHLQYDCLNAEVGCPQSCGKAMQRRKVDYHILHNCPLSLISCMFFSYDGDYCGYKCIRSELEEHQLTCNLRKVRCSNIGCSQRIVYKSLNEHDEICKFKKTICSNGCGEEFLTGVSHEHANICELETIKCSYSAVGCQETMLRKDLDQHLLDHKFGHCEMMVGWMKESSFRIEKLKFDMQSAKNLVFEEIRNIKTAIEANVVVPGVENIDLFLC